MALENAQSPALVNADKVPATRSTAGLGAKAAVIEAEAVITPTASADIHSTYEFFRVKSNVKLKEFEFQCADQGGTGTIDVGLYYAPVLGVPDGKYVNPPTYNGASLIDVDFILAALDTSGQATYAKVVPGGGFTIEGTAAALLAGGGGWTAAQANKELWDALGLTTDPRCEFSIIAQNHAAAGANAAAMWAKIKFVE